MLEQLTDVEFNEYAKNHPNSIFFQSSYWGDLKEFTGWKKHLVGMKENGEIIGASLLLSKKIPILSKNMFYAPRGFLIDYSNLDMVNQFTKEIVKYVKKNKGIFFKINPNVLYQERDINGDIIPDGIQNKELVQYLKKIGYQHNGFTIHYGKDLEPRWISVLDLKNKTEEDILNDMRPTKKADVQNSYKHGLQLVEIDTNRLHEFKELMVHTGERRGFIDRPLSYYQKMYEVFHPDHIKIMLVELNVATYIEQMTQQKNTVYEKVESLKNATNTKGKRQYKEFLSQYDAYQKRIGELKRVQEEKGDTIVVAGGLFMLFGNQIVSLFGASYHEYMKFNGQHFLNFEMIRYAIQNHYDYYNFYGITGEFEESSPMYGLFDFKRGFHANVVELIGEFTYVVNKPSYFIYNRMFGVYKKLKKWRLQK